MSRESMRPMSSMAPDNKSLRSCNVPDDFMPGRGDDGLEVESAVMESGAVDARGDDLPGACGDAMGVCGVLMMVGNVCVLNA